MRTTLTIDDQLVAEAKELTDIEENSSLVVAALKALIRQEAGKRLIALGGSDPKAEAPPRRRAA